MSRGRTKRAPWHKPAGVRSYRGARKPQVKVRHDPVCRLCGRHVFPFQASLTTPCSAACEEEQRRGGA